MVHDLINQSIQLHFELPPENNSYVVNLFCQLTWWKKYWCWRFPSKPFHMPMCLSLMPGIIWALPKKVAFRVDQEKCKPWMPQYSFRAL